MRFYCPFMRDEIRKLKRYLRFIKTQFCINAENIIFMRPVYVPVSTIQFAEFGYDILDLATIFLCL
jgi:hypothetical protein